jgi:hypothetical protein
VLDGDIDEFIEAYLMNAKINQTPVASTRLL